MGSCVVSVVMKVALSPRDDVDVVVQRILEQILILVCINPI